MRTSQTNQKNRTNPPNRQKKTLQELNLMDRFLCAEAVEDREFLEIVLSIILERDVSLKHPPQAEREIRRDPEKKKIRVDVWSTDEEDAVYDVEVQDRNTNNLPKRSRYYQGLMDSKLLPEGIVDYNRLNDAFIILIAPFDLFGRGRYRYTFSMLCEEEPDVGLGDGATRIFLNSRGKDPENVSGELVAMLRYFEESTAEVAESAGFERIHALHRKVESIRNNAEIGVKYMNAMEEKLLERQAGFEEGEAAGFERGEAKRALEIATKMLRKGMDKSVVAETTGLSIEQIDSIK